MAPFALDHDNTGLDAYWNDVVVGIAIVLVASIRMISPPTTAQWSIINVALGGWLLIAPFVLGYHEGADATTARWNDMVVGAIVVTLATTSWWMTTRTTRDPDN